MKLLTINESIIVSLYNELKVLGYKDSQFGFTTKTPKQFVIYQDSIINDSKFKEVLKKFNIVV